MFAVPFLPDDLTFFELYFFKRLKLISYFSINISIIDAV